MKKFAIMFLVCIIALVSCTTLITRRPSDDSLKAKVVKLTGNGYSCSGEQVRAPSGADYILSAGHCLPTAHNGSILVTTEDGRQLNRRIIQEDPNADLLLLEGIPNMRGIDIAETSYPTEHVSTYTHGAGFDTYRTDGILIQEITVDVPIESVAMADCNLPKYKIVQGDGIFQVDTCFLHVSEVVTTALIVPGSSGGLVVNNAGELVGVVSAGTTSFGMLVTLHDIHQFIVNY